LLALAFVWLAAPAAAGNLDLVEAARAQVGVTVVYDGSYQRMSYPGGDVPLGRGVCTDVVIRALRRARSIDLQKTLHEDMQAHWTAYPHPGGWNLAKPDVNIDHRRVPNLMTYFSRAGYSQPLSNEQADYLPGDIVAWNLGRGILHIGIVGDHKAPTGVPVVIHNIGAGAREEDILFRFAVIGHYRLPAN
jgi:uncharacterized protein